MSHNLWKKFKRVGFEEQIPEERLSDELFIAKLDKKEEILEKEKENFKKEEKKPEEKKVSNKKRQKKKKKTATDIHLEIKRILEKNPDLNGHNRAQIVLKKAFKTGFKGKRLDRWKNYLDEYFNSIKNTKVTTMGSSVKSAYSKKEKKKKFTNAKKDSKIQKSKKEIENMVDIPDLPLNELDEAAETEEESKAIEDESGGAVVYGILGAGQAGGRIAESFYNLGYKKVLAVNTAEHDLDGLANIPEEQKVIMKSGTGGGAGKDMSLALSVAEKYQQEIYEKMQLLFGKVDRILVCAGGGGGTGGGSCLRLVEAAKKYLQYVGVKNANKKVGVLLTLPTSGEANSPTVAENAYVVGNKLCEMADAGQISPLIIFDNDKIKKLYPKLTVRKFWPTVNSTVTGLFHMFNVLASKPSDLTSFDTADYNRVLSAGGCMIMGMTSLKEYQNGADVSKAIRGNTEKGLLCGGFDISTAKAAACIATAPASVLDNTPGLMNSFETGFDTLANITGNATVMRGVYEVSKEKVVVYTMLTGLEKPEARLNELKKANEQKVEKVELY